MVVYVIIESDFGHGSISSIHQSLDKARAELMRLEAIDNPEWISYFIEEWEVTK